MIKFVEKKSEWRLPDNVELRRVARIHRMGIGGFVDAIYLSSYENNSYSAWGVVIFNGEQITVNKSEAVKVRLVQSFISSESFKIGDKTSKGFVFDIIGNTIFICKKSDEKELYTWKDAIKKFGR